MARFPQLVSLCIFLEGVDIFVANLSDWYSMSPFWEVVLKSNQTESTMGPHTEQSSHGVNSQQNVHHAQVILYLKPLIELY